MKNLALGVLLAVATLLVGANLAAAQTAGSCYVFNNDLSYGMTFGEVLELQKFLAADGSFNVELTGTFGPLTRASLAQYQAKNGIQATGYFGPATRARVNAAGCGQVLGAFAQASAATVSSEKIKILEPRTSTTWQVGDTYTISWYPGSNAANMDAFFEVKKGGIYEKVARLITNPGSVGSMTWGGQVDNTPSTLTENSGIGAKPGKYFLSIVDRVTGQTARTSSQVSVVKYGDVVKLKATAHPDAKTRVEAKDEGLTPVTVKDGNIILSWSANADSCQVYAEVISELVPNETESYVSYDNERRHVTKKSFELPGNYEQYSVQVNCRKGVHTDVRSFEVSVKDAQPYTTPVLDHVEDEDGNWRIVADQTAFLFGFYFNSNTKVYVENDGDKYYFKTQLGKLGVIELLSIDLPAGTDNEFMLYAENGTKVSKPIQVEYRQPTQKTINVTSPDDGSVYDNGPDQNIGVSWEEYEGSFDYYRVGFHNHSANVGGLISGPINKNSNGYSFKSKVVTDFVEDLSGKTWPKEGYQMVVYAIKVDSAGEGTVAQGSSGTFEIWHSERSDLSITEIYGFPNQQKGILTAGGSARIYGEYDGLDGDFSGVLEGKNYNASFEADKSFANALTANIPSNVPAGRYDFYIQHNGVNSNRLDVQVVGGNGILCQFTRDLTLGSTGEDVRNLQNHLVSKGFLAAQTSQWSGYFGASTQEALARYQDSFGMSPAVGYFGPVTRAYMAANDPCYEVFEPETGMILVEDVSVDSDSEDGIGTFTYEVELTALEEDVYIPTSSGHSTDNAGFDWTIIGGLATSTITVQSDADIVGSNFVLEEGDNETFTIVITVDPLQSGSYYVILDDVTFDDGGTLTPPQTFDFEPTSMFDTPAVSVTMSTGPQPTRSARVAANTATYSHLSTIPNLSVGSTDPGVAAIQRFLNANGFVVNANAGQPGSVGYESSYFGAATQAALARFQASKGISPANGSFGPQTRAAMSL